MKYLVNLLFEIKLRAMEKTNLLGATLPELEDLMLELGEKEYKGRQLFKWLYNLQVSDFEQMTDLSHIKTTAIIGGATLSTLN